MHRYTAFNAAAPTTGAVGTSASANATKTLLQLSTPSTRQLTVISWGFSIAGTVGACTMDLIGTDVAATVTAHQAAGLVSLDPNAPASLLTLGTANTGYNASAEGATTVGRLFDSQQINATAGYNELNYSYQFMPDERPILAVSKFLRARITATVTTMTLSCWITWDE